jgi:hypothetical protein
MVAGECLALQDDLEFPINVRAIEGRHKQVDVCGQSLHNGHLRFGSAHNWRNKFGGTLIGINPGRKR